MTTLHRMRLLAAALLAVSALAASGLFKAAEAAGRRLAPLDTVQVKVLNQPELGTEVRVAPDGTLSLPYVSRFKVGGLTEDQVAERIKRALDRADVVKDAQVIVSVTNFGAQVSVSGAVRTPGAILLDRPSTLSDVLSKSGGLAPNSGTVIVKRRTNKGVQISRYDPKAALNGSSRSQNPYIQNGDEVFIDDAPIYYLYGFVSRPGSYPLTRAINVQQALANAGGLTELGSEWRIQIKRRAPDGTIEIVPTDLDQPVRADDIIIVKERFF